MQNNSNKYRAFIITFIVVMVLLIVGYFLLRGMGSSTTKGETLTQKFSSLFGISKQKQIDTVVDTGVNKNEPGVTPINIDNQTPDSTPQKGTVSQQGSDISTPGLNPFPFNGSSYVYNPISDQKSQCSDGIDNDGDGAIDGKDAGCHTDIDATNSSTYDQWLNDENAESGPNIVIDKPVNSGSCVPNRNIPLTADEQKRMNELLRDFYRLAPNLATAEDITIEKGNAKSYQETIDKASEYTNQCYSERNKNWPSASSAPIVMNKQEYANGSSSGVMDSTGGEKITIPPGKYMLEVKKSPLFTSNKITPSDSFIPSFNGIKFEIPTVLPTPLLRESWFEKGGYHGNHNDVRMSLIVQYADGDAAGMAIASHVLQGMKDVGILKYYLPDTNYPQANYDLVLKILREETSKYMNTLNPARSAWSGHDSLSSFENWATNPANTGETQQYGHGYFRTIELLDLYIKSGSTDELRRVDVGSASWIFKYNGDWYNGLYEKKNINPYQSFEEAYDIW